MGYIIKGVGRRQPFWGDGVQNKRGRTEATILRRCWGWYGSKKKKRRESFLLPRNPLKGSIMNKSLISGLVLFWFGGWTYSNWVKFRSGGASNVMGISSGEVRVSDLKKSRSVVSTTKPPNHHINEKLLARIAKRSSRTRGKGPRSGPTTTLHNPEPWCREEYLVIH